MERTKLSFVVMVFGLIFPMVLLGCDGGDSGEDRSDGQQPTVPTASAFNGTFGGDITTTRGGQSSVESINLSLTAGSPLSGTFFRRGAQNVGTISGDAGDRSATFAGMSGGDCPDSFRGSMTLSDDNTLSFAMEGSDCNGSFVSNGRLVAIACIDMAGTYRVRESGAVTCTVGGERETETTDSTRTIPLEQNGCHVSYVPPEGNFPREGTIAGNSINFSGQFVFALEGDLRATQNVATIKGQIIDEGEFTADGSGIATGTIDGQPFSCTGSSTAVFKRCFDVAVAVLRGASEFADFKVDSDLDMIRTQAMRVDPKRVIASGFGSGPGQLSRVGQWLTKINKDCDRPAKVILIGHSLGGDAVRRSNFSNMCSRITIDPINPDLLPILNQRLLTFSRVSTSGRFINVLASTTEDLDGVKGRFLLGHHIAGAMEDLKDKPPTNHFTVVTRVQQSSLVSDEVKTCLK